MSDNILIRFEKDDYYLHLIYEPNSMLHGNFPYNYRIDIRGKSSKHATTKEHAINLYNKLLLEYIFGDKDITINITAHDFIYRLLG